MSGSRPPVPDVSLRDVPDRPRATPGCREVLPEIRPLARLDARDFKRIVTGYRSPARYRVVREDWPDRTAFRLALEPLAEPYVKRFGPFDRPTVRRYQRLLRHGASLGAYAGGTLVALAIAEPHRWNSSLWVWEFHVADAYRGRGVGTRLMDALVDRAAALGLRMVVCETQNTNVPAIQFYRKRGFVLDGVDLSYYGAEAGEVAVFMKRHLQGVPSAGGLAATALYPGGAL